MNTLAVSAAFTREHLRTRLNLVLLIIIPTVFVVLAASVLGDFSTALGGRLAGQGATALGAGWAAAYLAGLLGFFEVASSRDADRRLALAGLGPLRVAAARLLASLALALIVTAVAMVVLLLRARIEHPEHAALGIAAYAVTYLAIGSIVGAFVRDPLTGSMAVMFVFLIDTFSGPGMGQSAIPTVSTYPARLLMAAGAGGASSTSDWARAVVTILVALCLAAGTFWLAARARSR